MNIYNKISEAVTLNKEFAVVTITETTGSVARGAGTMMLVYSDGSIEGTVGGGVVEQGAINDGLVCLNDGLPLLKTYEIRGGLKGDVLNGSVTCFINPHRCLKRLYVLGAGHVNQELVPLAKKAGFHVTVIDPREELLRLDNIRVADRVIFDDYRVVDEMNIEKGAYFMIGTYGHEIDGELLGKALKYEAKYVGMLGGRPKITNIFRKLRADGFDDDTLLQVHTPAGLDIGGQEPFEIAVSIVSEMLAVSNDKRGGFSSGELLKQIIDNL